MSNTADRLYKAAFPDDYADILIETLAITPENVLSIKDALYHFRYLDDDQAAEAMQQIVEAAATVSAKTEIDIDAYLAERQAIGVTWCIEDVLIVQPDLTNEQAWEVLQQVKDVHNAEYGISWTTLETVADDLFGNAPETDETEEA